MRRPWWSRACALPFVLWFTLLSVEPGPLGSCPMHGGHGTAAADGRGAAHHHGTAGGGEHSAAVRSGADAAAPEQPERTGHSCTCLGDCAGVIWMVALPARAGAPLPPAIAAERAADGASRVLATATDRRLPFAIGPPAEPVFG